MSQSQTMVNGIDAWVGQGEPDRNNSTGAQLQIGVENGMHARSFIYFQNPAPRGATIVEAKLRLFTASAWGTGQVTVNVHRNVRPAGADPNWTLRFAHLTWNNQPPESTVFTGHTDVHNAANALVEVGVVHLMQQIANGAPNYGFRISTPQTARRYHFWSLNATHHKPRLYVEWSDAPQTPTNLHPSGGVVSIANPVLQWQYTDVGAGSAMHALQVQVDSAPVNWASPNFNSGTVLSSEPELNLANTAHTGLADGQTRYWRVRHQDAAGLWSRWSARGTNPGASFTRATKGTLTMTTPNTDGFIDDWSPPVAWTFTGRTQSHWQVSVHDPDTHDLIWSTGKRTGEDTSTTIPHNDEHHPINEWARTYRIVLQVWDHQDRVATPGDPMYSSVTRDVTLRHHPIPVPTNFTGTSDPDGKPFMHLQWNFPDDTPDSWVVVRDGKRVAKFPGVDAGPGPGGVYRWIDRDLRQNIGHEWTLRAFRNGQHGPPATWTGRVNNDHAWLLDWGPDDLGNDRIVAILDPDISFEEPDTSATYEPVAANKVIRVIQQHRGMQGTVSGRLIGTQHWTLHDHRQNFLWMKQQSARQANRTFRLAVGNQTWKVLLGDMTDSPMRMPGGAAVAVSFSFWSVDGPELPA